jgi:Druantia protein DruA
VRNLASAILARAARQLPADWHDCYGYAPVLLETFIDTNRFTGASYQTAGWT